jgi:hypothetical protein
MLVMYPVMQLFVLTSFDAGDVSRGLLFVVTSFDVDDVYRHVLSTKIYYWKNILLPAKFPWLYTVTVQCTLLENKVAQLPKE